MDIAVIGMSVRMPDADKLDQYWDILKHGKCCVKGIPLRRKQYLADYFNKVGTPCPEYSDASYLADIEMFDPEFFHITPKNALLMDPNQRIFLETAAHCFMDAGYTKQKLYKSNTGVFLGYCDTSQYIDLISVLQPDFLSMAMIPNCASVIAGRLSYLYNLRGPNITINTVCSSSLVAVQTACRAIQAHDCDVAVAGGIQLHVLPVRKASIGVESSDGYTRTFDAAASGTGCGEGCGVVLLKPLEQALKDNDAVYAVIKGGAVNHDGLSVGISAPNPLSQADVIVRALHDADVNAESISYIEAHGTGTLLGDPIEIEGITKAFERFTGKKRYCAIGSVKTNMGHLDGAAGIAGFIKAVLCLKNKHLVPSLFYRKANRNINFEDSPVYVSTSYQKWEVKEHPRRCGISSFGLSGTNCHIILEEAKKTYSEVKGSHCQTGTQRDHLFVVSAESVGALKRWLNSYYLYLCEHPTVDIGNLCNILVNRRDHYRYRVAYKVKDTSELLAILKTVRVGDDPFAFRTNIDLGGQPEDEADGALQSYLAGDDQALKIRFPDNGYHLFNLPLYPYDKHPFWVQYETNFAAVAGNTGETDPLQKAASLSVVSKMERSDAEKPLIQRIASLYREILGVKTVSDDDDFFDLGGDSVAAMVLIEKIQDWEKKKVTLQDIVQFATPLELSAYIENQEG